MLIWNQLKIRAAAEPNKSALICGDTVLTYAQFAAQAERVAHAWLRKGLQRGDRIALHMRNGIELATCYYACFAAGFVAVPVNTRLTPEEIAYVLENSGARAYIAQSDLRIPTSVPSWEFDAAAPGHCKSVLPAPRPDDPALLLYTSGTTAQPKGVSHSQRTLAGRSHFTLYRHGARHRIHPAADIAVVDGRDGDHSAGVRPCRGARRLGAK
jgi:long-chain acyl-CoA synthetase